MAEVLKVSKVILLNDFVALGYGLLALGPNEKKQLNRVDVVKDSPIACLGEDGEDEEEVLESEDGLFRCRDGAGTDLF